MTDDPTSPRQNEQETTEKVGTAGWDAERAGAGHAATRGRLAAPQKARVPSVRCNTYGAVAPPGAPSGEGVLRGGGAHLLNGGGGVERRGNYCGDSAKNGCPNGRGRKSAAVGWCTAKLARFNPALMLENRASVARDHLANERTYLAWLRTSLSLTSIGVAVTQLFRLTSPLDAIPDAAASRAAPFPSNFTLPLDADVEALLASLYAEVQEQGRMLQALGTGVQGERRDYVRLGKPIGVTFIGLGLLFLSIGTYRYFAVQHHLQHGRFPSSRRSISFASFCVGALVVAAFSVILSFSPRRP